MAGIPSSSNVLALALLLLVLLAGGCDDEPAPPSREAQPTAPQAVQPPPAPQPSAEGPVVAELNGKRVEGLAASYMRGILTLYTGEDPDNRYGEKI